MGTFLDQRSSMNASTTIAIPLSTTPVLFGDIGLQTQGIAGNGLGNNGSLIVNLSGTIGVSLGVASTVTINVVRGGSIAGGTIIYTAQSPFLSAVSQNISFSAQDLLAPAALETQYTAFVTGTGLGGVLAGTRVGPEAFWGTASVG
ncbi:hypothetical protein COLU111180_04740 [Cohnella lubricantis]|uniref:Uncharacterized protein n=1 Tax=Cohnella lubricantis TaxID=2163172 RepID=A0A841TD80_9BACL|nr:hypothetical protein [Cohnella lubricantis]MBB6677190.1 hypothetical protein [Cohnella lubricantis]MBP2116999.1 hypothetical protein [Cohnella lubricantis]